MTSQKDCEQAAKARFDTDTTDHQMTVLHDDGLYRHLHFQAPDTGFYWFDVITWPGVLTLRGDMGTWTFARTDDMLQFFRGSSGLTRINPGYWGEKLQGGNTSGNQSCEEYDGDLFTEVVNQEVNDFLESRDWPFDVREQLVADVRDNVLEDRYGNTPPASEDLAREAVDGYEFETTHATEASQAMADALGAVTVETSYRFEFTDAWEWDLKQPSTHFLWCCWAIVHAVAAYDAHKADPATVLAADRAQASEAIRA